MSRKWVEKEGRRWVEAGIVSKDQVEQIKNLYEERQRAIGLLPLLGSILVGLGILSFIAANWQEIPSLARLAIILVSMVGFYMAGEKVNRAGQDRLGIALTAIGFFTFGAGIFLIAQMFHLIASDTLSMAIWGLAGIVLSLLYRSRFLLLLGWVVLAIGQGISCIRFEEFSYVTFFISAACLAILVKQFRSSWLTAIWTIAILVQFMFFVGVHEWQFAWFIIPAALLYMAADRSGDWLRRPIQLGVWTVMYGFSIVMVFFSEEMHLFRDSTDVEKTVYFLSAAAILGVSAWWKWKHRELISLTDWLLFMPYFLLPNGASVLYLAALLIFSLTVMWRGYEEHDRGLVNGGTVLFVISTLVGYIRMTWDFMDKSLFFLIGGVLLLLLSWYLNRRRKHYFEQNPVEGVDGP